MKSELVVGDYVVCFKGFRRRVGRKYQILSITLTDMYLQDIWTNKCTNFPIRWVMDDFVKVSKRVCVHEDSISQDDEYMYCPNCNEVFKEGCG